MKKRKNRKKSYTIISKPDRPLDWMKGMDGSSPYGVSGSSGIQEWIDPNESNQS